MLQMDDRAKNFCLALKIVVFNGTKTHCSLEQWLSTARLCHQGCFLTVLRLWITLPSKDSDLIGLGWSPDITLLKSI